MSTHLAWARVACWATLAIGLAAAPACSSTPAQPAADLPAPGVLRVRLTGLPQGLSGQATVTGPNNYKVSVSSDVDLAVPAGAYSVISGAVGGKDTTPFYAPSEPTSDVTVTASAGTTVDVDYAELPVAFAADVRQVDPSVAATLSSATLNPDGTGTLVFAASSQTTSSWAVGDVLLLPRSAQTPQGFEGRIATTDGVTITTQPVSLTDVYASGGASTSVTLTSLDLANGTSFATCPSLSTTIQDPKSPVGAILEIDGQACLTPSMSLSFWVDWKFHAHAYFEVGSAMSFTLTGTAGVGLNLGINTSFGRFSYAGFDLGPLVIVPEVEIHGTGSVSAEAGLFAGITLADSFDAGFGWDSNKSPQFRTFASNSSHYDPIYPTPIGKVNANLQLGPQLNLLVDGIAGPFLSVRGVLDYTLDTTQTPLWSLSAGLNVTTGLQTANFIGKTYNETVWQELVPLIDSAATPPVGGMTGKGGLVGGWGIAADANDTMYVASGNTVVATQLNHPLWTYTSSDPQAQMSHVAVAPDGTVYASDFASTVYAIDSTGKQKWTAPSKLVGGLAVGAGAVYAIGFDTAAYLDAYSTADGSVLWSVPLAGSQRDVAIGKSGTVYALSDAIYAIDPSTHAVLWTGGVAGSSDLAIGSDGTLYQISVAGALVAVNPADGTTKWTSVARFDDEYTGASLGPDGTAYWCALSHLLAFNPSSITTSAPNGHFAFQVALPNGALCKAPPTVGADGRLYVSANGGLFVYDGTTSASPGRLEWSKSVSGSTYASPVLLSSKNVVVTPDNGLAAFYAGTTLAATSWPRRGGGNASTGSPQ